MKSLYAIQKICYTFHVQRNLVCAWLLSERTEMEKCLRRFAYNLRRESGREANFFI